MENHLASATSHRPSELLDVVVTAVNPLAVRLVPLSLSAVTRFGTHFLATDNRYILRSCVPALQTDPFGTCEFKKCNNSG
eukprot:3648348-Amphidinium_carterae.1